MSSNGLSGSQLELFFDLLVMANRSQLTAMGIECAIEAYRREVGADHDEPQLDVVRKHYYKNLRGEQ
jgi:hypothetical protein